MQDPDPYSGECIASHYTRKKNYLECYILECDKIKYFKNIATEENVVKYTRCISLQIKYLFAVLWTTLQVLPLSIFNTIIRLKDRVNEY